MRHLRIRGRHLFFSVANWKNRRESFYHLRVVNQHQICFGYLLTPGRARCKIDLVQKNLIGSVEELEWNQRNLAGIGIEPGCLFLQVPSTLAPISLFGPPLLRAKSHLKEGRPWMTFLSRSNEGRRFFQFAIENFKRRPLAFNLN